MNLFVDHPRPGHSSSGNYPATGMIFIISLVEKVFVTFLADPNYAKIAGSSLQRASAIIGGILEPQTSKNSEGIVSTLRRGEKIGYLACSGLS